MNVISIHSSFLVQNVIVVSFLSRIFQKFATSSQATTVIGESLQWERSGHAVVSDPDPSYDQGSQHQLQPHPDR